MYGELKRYDEALADLTQALTLDPHYSWAFGQRGHIFRMLGRFSETLADFDRAVEIDPQAAKNLRVDRGLVLSYLGRYAEASHEHQQAIADDPEDLPACYDLAVVLARWQGLAAAAEAIQRAEALLATYEAADRDRGLVAYGRGGLEAVRGEADHALAFLAEAIAELPDTQRWARYGVEWMDLRGDARFEALVRDP